MRKEDEAHLPDYLDICRPRAIVRRYRVHHPDDVALHHAHIVDVAVLIGHVEKVFDEVHDVGASVHVVLRVLPSAKPRERKPEPLTLSNCSRMQECKSSAMSRYFRAYCAAFCAEVTDALSWRSWLVKRIRTSNGSAMVLSFPLLIFSNLSLNGDKYLWRGASAIGRIVTCSSGLEEFTCGGPH